MVYDREIINFTFLKLISNHKAYNYVCGVCKLKHLSCLGYATLDLFRSMQLIKYWWYTKKGAPAHLNPHKTLYNTE